MSEGHKCDWVWSGSPSRGGYHCRVCQASFGDPLVRLRVAEADLARVTAELASVHAECTMRGMHLKVANSNLAAERSRCERLTTIIIKYDGQVTTAACPMCLHYGWHSDGCEVGFIVREAGPAADAKGGRT